MKDATEFAKEQAPLVVQEFLEWEILLGTFYGVLVLFITLTVGVLLHKAFKTLTREQVRISDMEVNICLAQISVAVLMAVTLIPTVPAAMSGLKAYVAPRVVVLEQVKQWVR